MHGNYMGCSVYVMSPLLSLKKQAASLQGCHEMLEYKFLYGYTLQLLLGKYLGVEWLASYTLFYISAITVWEF